jgi:hypothetical protein
MRIRCCSGRRHMAEIYVNHLNSNLSEAFKSAGEVESEE